MIVLRTDKLTDTEKHLLITMLMSLVQVDTRNLYELRQTLPAIYNKLIGTDVMEVRQKGSDAMSISSPKHATLGSDREAAATP